MTTSLLTPPYLWPGPGLTHGERQARTHQLFDLVAETDDAQTRQHALDEIVQINARVARAVANRYTGRGVDVDDLRQTAYEALVKAAHRFDRTQGRDFLTYAVPTIRGEVQRYFRDKSWMIRPGRTVQETQGRLNRYVAKFVADHDREPTEAECCEALEIKRTRYIETVAAFGCFQPPSLNRPVRGSSDALEVGELIADEHDDFAAVEARAVLEPALARLPQRDRELLRMHFYEGETHTEISARLGLRRGQVAAALLRVLGQLRDQLVELGDLPRAA